MNESQRLTLEKLEKTFKQVIDYEKVNQMTDEEVEEYINKIDDDLFNSHFDELNKLKKIKP